MARVATASKKNSSAPGAARPDEDEPQVHFNGSEPTENLHGDAGDDDYFGEETSFGTSKDFSSIHGAETLTLHGSHEADELPEFHPGWLDFGRRSNLEAPPPRPGFEQRWIRTEVRGNHDVRNSRQKQLRRGWIPRNPETIPEYQRLFPVMRHSSGADCVCIDGLVLCERPIKFGDLERNAIDERGRRLKAAVAQNIMRETAEGARRGWAPPEQEERRRVIGGSRKRPNVLSDSD